MSGAPGPALRPAELPADLEALLALDGLAAEAAEAFVHDDASGSRTVRTLLLERGAAEWGPPVGRLLTVPGDDAAGILAVLPAAELARRRMAGALALRRAGSAIDPQVAERLRLAGTTLLRPDAGDMYLSRIAVRPVHAGRGLGRWLLDQALAAARDAGAARLVLDVAEDNAGARAFYARAGFAAIGHGEATHEPTGRRVAYVHLAHPLP